LGSMGFVGDALVLAVAESFYATLKARLLGQEQLANTRRA